MARTSFQTNPDTSSVRTTPEEEAFSLLARSRYMSATERDNNFMVRALA